MSSRFESIQSSKQYIRTLLAIPATFVLNDLPEPEPASLAVAFEDEVVAEDEVAAATSEAGEPAGVEGVLSVELAPKRFADTPGPYGSY